MTREKTRTPGQNCGCKRAQRSPLCSPSRTAIKLPGSENHSHQLGSNPVESKTQLITLSATAPHVKQNLRRQAPPPAFRGCPAPPDGRPAAADGERLKLWLLH